MERLSVGVPPKYPPILIAILLQIGGHFGGTPNGTRLALVQNQPLPVRNTDPTPHLSLVLTKDTE